MFPPATRTPPAIVPRRDERPLRVAFLVPEDRQTGTYFRYHNLAIALRRSGHDVTVYSQTNVNRRRPSAETRDGIPYRFSPTVPGNRLMIAPVNPGNVVRRLAAHLAPADVYHLFQPYPTAALQWLAALERRSGLFVYDWDDYWINDHFGLKQPRGLNARWTALWTHLLERSLPPRCHLLTTLSHAIAALSHRLGCPRTALIYNGVWAEPALAPALARRELGLAPDAFYVGLMGWSGENRWAFSGVQQLSQAMPGLRVACTGQDPRPLLAEFPQIASRVDYLGFLPSGRPMLAFRCAVDLGLLPMADEEFNRYRLPYKLTDFLSAGTPVLASNVGETAIFARRWKGIIPVPPTPEAWRQAFASTVGTMQADPAAHRVDPGPLVEEIDWIRVTARLVDVYRESIQARRRAV